MPEPPTADPRRVVLLNPGPVTMTPRVRDALASADLCHREPEFAALLSGVRERLARVYPEGAETHEPFLVAGSGTAAVEAMLQTLAPGEGRTLVATNGVYGERMASMLEAAGKAPVVVRADWLEPMDLDGVERALATNDAISHVVAVQNETTSGRLNRLEPLGELCRRTGKRLLLDAVSSYGAEELSFAGWNLEALASTANKCLHGAPGASFVLVRRGALEEPTHATTCYLDLARYAGEQRSGWSPFTSPVHVLLALREALDELDDQGGVPARLARYRELSGRLREHLLGLGVRPLIDPAELSSMISAFHLPDGVAYDELHDALKERGFVIYAGQGPLSGRIFRVANMGDVTDADLVRLLAALDELLG